MVRSRRHQSYVYMYDSFCTVTESTCANQMTSRADPLLRSYDWTSMVHGFPKAQGVDKLKILVFTGRSPHMHMHALYLRGGTTTIFSQSDKTLLVQPRAIMNITDWSSWYVNHTVAITDTTGGKTKRHVVHVMKHTPPRKRELFMAFFIMAYHMHPRTLPDLRIILGRRQTLLIRS